MRWDGMRWDGVSRTFYKKREKKTFLYDQRKKKRYSIGVNIKFSLLLATKKR